MKQMLLLILMSGFLFSKGSENCPKGTKIWKMKSGGKFGSCISLVDWCISQNKIISDKNNCGSSCKTGTSPDIWAKKCIDKTSKLRKLLKMEAITEILNNDVKISQSFSTCKDLEDAISDLVFITGKLKPEEIQDLMNTVASMKDVQKTNSQIEIEVKDMKNRIITKTNSLQQKIEGLQFGSTTMKSFLRTANSLYATVIRKIKTINENVAKSEQSMDEVLAGVAILKKMASTAKNKTTSFPAPNYVELLADISSIGIEIQNNFANQRLAKGIKKSLKTIPSVISIGRSFIEAMTGRNQITSLEKKVDSIWRNVAAVTASLHANSYSIIHSTSGLQNAYEELNELKKQNANKAFELDNNFLEDLQIDYENLQYSANRIF